MLKMAAVRPYLLTDQYHFRQHLDVEENSYARFRLNSSSGFGGDNGENQRWLSAATFVNGPEPFSGGHN